MNFFFFKQYLYKLKCINLCLKESGSRSSNDWHLLSDASPIVSKENIQDSNSFSPNYEIIKRIEKQEFGSPPRLEGQYGCIDLVEINPSIGQLSRLFVLELEEGRYHLPRRFISRRCPTGRNCLKDLEFNGMSRRVGILFNGICCLRWLKRPIPDSIQVISSLSLSHELLNGVSCLFLVQELPYSECNQSFPGIGRI